MLQTYNDDQLARKLDLLFKADRNSFMAELSSNAIDVYLLETKQIHNDSTSITFLGQYENDDSKAVKLKHGFNKDHRPDCKQIVFGLNITADGNVPRKIHLNYLTGTAPMIQPISPIGTLFENSWENQILYILPTANYVQRKIWIIFMNMMESLLRSFPKTVLK